jgi:hypothetical protein
VIRSGVRVALVLVSLSVASSAAAQTQAPVVDLGPRIYAAPEAIGGALLLLGIRAVEKSHFPRVCSWCDDQLNPFDTFWRDHLVWSPANRPRAATLSNLTLGLAPVLATGVAAVGRRGHKDAGEPDAWWKNPCRGSWRLTCEDAGVALESLGVASVVTDGYKLLAGRERPQYRFMTPEERRQHAGDS